MFPCSGDRRTERIFSPIRVPPGSLVRKTGRPSLASPSAARRICVVLPDPSMPSKVTKSPAKEFRLFFRLLETPMPFRKTRDRLQPVGRHAGPHGPNLSRPGKSLSIITETLRGFKRGNAGEVRGRKRGGSPLAHPAGRLPKPLELGDCYVTSFLAISAVGIGSPLRGSQSSLLVQHRCNGGQQEGEDIPQVRRVRLVLLASSQAHGTASGIIPFRAARRRKLSPV